MKSAILPLAHAALASGLFAAAWGVLPTVAVAESPVSFSDDQAESGKVRFEKDCVECHGATLKGGLIGGPPLRGVQFLEKFAEGAPASVMFSYMSSAMPPNAPGRYSAKAYADLMAYILKVNGFKAGAPLPSDLEALDELIVEK